MILSIFLMLASASDAALLEKPAATEEIEAANE
jgi:hypothetical protein